jgi:allantoinase
MAVLGNRVKVNPPLRSRANRELLWERLAEGRIDVIGSDHTPWPLVTKDRLPVLEAASGAPSLDWYPSLLLGAAMARNVPLQHVVAAAARRPAEVFGLGAAKGDIAPGLDADLIVFDPDAEWTVDPAAAHSATGWSPYDRSTRRGRVVTTLLRGEVVWDGVTAAERPTGRILRPGAGPRPASAKHPTTPRKEAV